MKCNHTQSEQYEVFYCRYFVETLGTDPAYLNRLCNKKLNNIAKYNFHLDVVSHQVKNKLIEGQNFSSTFCREFSPLAKKAYN